MATKRLSDPRDPSRRLVMTGGGRGDPPMWCGQVLRGLIDAMSYYDGTKAIPAELSMGLLGGDVLTLRQREVCVHRDALEILHCGSELERLALSLRLLRCEVGVFRVPMEMGK